MRTRRPSTRLPKQWSKHVKSGILHAIALASVALSYARGRATGARRLRAQLEQATSEIALLSRGAGIKDGRWARSHHRRRPHYTPIQRMRILQLRAARGWTLEKTARVFLVDEQTLFGWMSRLDEPGERPLVQTAEPVNRYPDFVRSLVRQLKTLFPAMGSVRMAQTLARAGLHLGATTIRRIVRETQRTPRCRTRSPSRASRRVVARYPGHTWHLDLTAVPIRAGLWVPVAPALLAAALALLLVRRGPRRPGLSRHDRLRRVPRPADLAPDPAVPRSSHQRQRAHARATSHRPWLPVLLPRLQALVQAPRHPTALRRLGRAGEHLHRRALHPLAEAGVHPAPS